MIASSAVTVTCSWLPSGALFLWGARSPHSSVDPLEFKHQLFAWHEESFYGTFIDTAEHLNKEGVILPASLALDYFCETVQLQHASFRWSPELEALRKLAPAVRQALEEGRCMPDFEKWKKGAIGWKLDLPDDDGSAEGTVAKEWMNTLLTEWARKQPAFRDALARLEQAHPQLREGSLASGLWLDEEDWLVAIGWKRDSSPFRTCLQLVEPEEGREWRLQVLLQDRRNAAVLLACSPQGMPTGDVSLPEDWQDDIARVGKDVQRWLHILPWLREPGEPGRMREEISHDEAWEFLAHGSLRLAEAGSTVFLPAWWERVSQLKPRLRAKIKSPAGAAGESMFGIGQLMQFDWRLAVGDMELTEAEFIQLIEEKRKLVRFRGRWIQLDPRQLAQIEQAIKKVKKKKGLSLRDVLELHLLGTADAEQAAQDAGDPRFDEDSGERLEMEVELNGHLLRLIDQLKEQSSIPRIVPPAQFRGELRPYQLDGVSWMMFLRRFGLGGCLADDMGLGKTIQWITYLLAIKHERLAASSSLQDGEAQPSLLICPTSVLGNWQKELQRFAPELQVHLHYGPNRLKGDAFTQAVMQADLVMTSYTLAHLDEQELTQTSWNSICLDEAQNIKNAYTKQAAAVRKLDGYHRIALTGTPIENRLTELWSIMDFLNPGYLGTLREFSARYALQIEKSKDTAAIAKVQQLIRPFMLRRVKKDPAIQLDLPDKYESKSFVSLTPEQASLYENYIQDMFSRIDRSSAMERRGLILTALTKLKQVCNHPAMLLKEGTRANWRERSNKLERVIDMVSELRQEGDKCLIFTQFVETGHMLQSVLAEELKEPVLFLHGGTPKASRDRMIEEFQSGQAAASASPNVPANANDAPAADYGVFVLSLKAGGTGLNLTAANHVFHFDRWWNPAVENQATDRAFRIGQTRHVQVHKFVTLGTLEERIDEMIERKQSLSQQIVGSGENWITELSTAELRDIFALRRDWVESD
ncbi:DEAD/DEAH box helicase [Paenibacillus sp. MBLB4367]|uniref:DEAD/DEAH box helicase n=1 Tax=Paenibacillus sp. MBLB4367 TaxID=3384767 RepID=UPI00390802A9